jgi:exodeoxyribonuclease V beta subunit
MQTESYLDCAITSLQRGVNLVEASAGTGKTYAIAMLVLRCITELEVPIDKILVVTFTKAATEELRSRIRQRLVEARDLLEGTGSSTDKTMQVWAETITDSVTVKKRLQLALFDIDRAGIFTIHSFCQRMLTEQALESGQLFDVELLADIDHIRSQVVEDYWRRRLYTLQPRPCGIVTSKFSTPAELFKSVARVGWDYARLEPVTCSVEDAVDQFETCYRNIAHWWQVSAVDLYSYFQRTQSEGKFKKPLSEVLESWWQSLADYFSGVGCSLPEHLGFLTAVGLKDTLNATKVKKNIQDKFLADWPLPGQLVTDFIAAAETLLLAMRRDLVLTVKQEVDSRLYDQGHMSFDDLILRLDRALAHEVDGAALQRILRERFSVALIDEFQDTDSAQWHIFSSLFASGSHYLYLIGDPKQAIYRFRGADIFSYFKARETADQKLTLQNNYRSHPDLVHEVNRIFMGRTRPFSFDENMLPFQPVAPAKTAEDGSLFLGGQPLGVMEYCQLAPFEKDKAGRWTSGRAAAVFRNYVIAETCRLLDSANPAVRRQIKDGIEVESVLQARDIAVLVRSNTQADEYLQAFAAVNIPAVVSSKKGVFETLEAKELYTLLQALVAPGNSYTLKTAMTISWFDLTGGQLQRIWEDEQVFDDWFNRFLIYNQLWQERGFLSMMNRLMIDEQVYVTVAGAAMAERRMANIHHLLEIVQETEMTDKLGPDQTLLWLRSMLAGEPGVEDRELRLESDEQAVRIVTMHSAKGLQYPVVFCPYLWYRSGRLRTEQNLISCHDTDNQLAVDLGSSRFDERRELAIAEELAEDLRLLYVALTRAELRCYTMWVDVKNSGYVADSFSSGLGYLLYPEGVVGSDEQYSTFQAMTANPGVEHFFLEPASNNGPVYSPPTQVTGTLATAIASARSLHTDYQMSSYSAMAALSEHEDHGSDVSIEASDIEETEILQIPHLGLPAGAHFGNLVHDSLELLTFASLGRKEDNSREIERLCNRYGIDLKAETVQELLASIVTTPLFRQHNGAPGFSLAQLREKRCMKEMPFYFHLDRLETETINEILTDEPTVVHLSYRMMQGYLTGFVDLVCEHEGRFYILDYKTNFLGDRLSDYCGENLVRAMASHNYGLQYWIYTLVLHRHLQNVMVDYDYETHFGGVMYLFVRGMVPDMPGSGVFATLPSVELLTRLDMSLGGGK